MFQPNDWKLTIENATPFHMLYELRRVALEHNAENEIIDLSQGDGASACSPGVRAREFMAFLLFLDTKFNNAKRSFAQLDQSQEKVILEEIGSWARSTYVPALAERHLKDLSEFIQRAILIGKDQAFLWTPFAILKFLFHGSMVSGGSSVDPQGALLVRVILTWWHKNFIEHDISFDDLVICSGTSHAIGSLFKLLGQEGLQYLNPGDKVVVTSPLYAPYHALLEQRGLQVLTISTNPITGEIEPRSLDLLKTVKGVKMLILSNPNNPSGMNMDEHTLNYLGQFAEDQDALIVADEVYSALFEDHVSLVDLHPKRTIRLHSASKIERSAGLRFGDLLLTREANDYLTHHLLKGLLAPGLDFKQSFINAKGPGSARGEFQHNTYVPGPSQILLIAHLLLGNASRQGFRDTLVENMEIFKTILSLPHENNRFYLIFDLNEVPGCNKTMVSAEQKILELAKRGVIVLPASMFFSKEDRDLKNRHNYVRACLVNGDPVKIEQAAKIIRDYLIS